MITSRKILLLLLIFVFFSRSLFAAKEALLIANADYTNFGKLPNPLPDARKLSAALNQIGFSVNLVENASLEQMEDAIAAFEERLKITRGIAFFHYGGHGVQVNGQNFLIPANADIPDERRVNNRALNLQEVMDALDASGSAANIVVLDACRDNPLPATTRSATRGLSVVQAKPKNSIIIFAAEAGSKAQDGLFTPILANAIITPGQSISDVAMEVRRQVNQQSGGSQTPGEYNQLFDKIILANSDSPSSFVPPAPQIQPPAPPTSPPPAAFQPPQVLATATNQEQLHGKIYTVAYRGEDGVSLRSEPGGQILATLYYGPDTLLSVLSNSPVNYEGLSWIQVSVRGWMGIRNLKNGDINIASTTNGGVVTWDGGGDPNDNFIAMRTLGSKGKRIAKVYHRTRVGLGEKTISGNYEWVFAETIGWLPLLGPKGSTLVQPVN
jgi:hypothetical protein